MSKNPFQPPSLYSSELKRDSRRTFNQTQKKEILYQQDSKCAVCHKKLDPRAIQFDHDKPWASGGRTISQNGRALCGECHDIVTHTHRLKKVDRKRRTKKQADLYKLAKNEKQVFKSKHDYQIALTHSKRLFFSDERANTQRFDYTSPYLAIDLLVYKSEKDVDDSAILQHLKTGYPEIYDNLQKYRQLMDETGLSKRTCLPKLGGSIDFDDEPSEKPLATTPVTIDDIVEFDSGTLGRSDIIGKVSVSKVREILNLRDLLVERIYGHLMNTVRNGAPLRGFCDFCPNREIMIK